jgi:hypothetical protein
LLTTFVVDIADPNVYTSGITFPGSGYDNGKG